MFIGVSILAPFAAKPVANFVGAPLPRLFGISGQLARENTKRKPRRTASTASALMIGVALVAFFSVFAASTKASIEETVRDVFPADLTIQSTNQSDPERPGPFSPAFTAEIRELAELDVVSALRFGRIEAEGSTEFIGGIEPETINDVFALKPVGPALTNLSQPNSVMVSTSILERRGWAIGQEINIKYAATGDVATTIAGAFDGDDFGDFYVSSNTYESNFSDIGESLVFARAAPDVTVEAAQMRVEAIADSYGNIKVQTKTQLVEEAEDQINAALGSSQACSDLPCSSPFSASPTRWRSRSSSARERSGCFEQSGCLGARFVEWSAGRPSSSPSSGRSSECFWASSWDGRSRELSSTKASAPFRYRSLRSSRHSYSRGSAE